ncbi:MAG: purine-binding chemotaxis protein CheW [Verrucomicrobiales bacterium]|nr:purine-binding chemotaxis protein CheW [Verrucomicrobiales bacterium]
MTSSLATPLAPAPSAHLAGKYLTFAIGTESYAVDVRQVREIIRLTSITSVPQMPPFIRGVINLRGKIIPVVDLRIQFGLPPAPPTDHTCVVVVHTPAGPAAHRETGLLVDSVEEVLSLGAADLESTPDFGSQLDTACLLGMAKVKGAVKMLLNLDRILGHSDPVSLNPTTPAS